MRSLSLCALAALASSDGLAQAAPVNRVPSALCFVVNPAMTGYPISSAIGGPAVDLAQSWLAGVVLKSA